MKPALGIAVCDHFFDELVALSSSFAGRFEPVQYPCQCRRRPFSATEFAVWAQSQAAVARIHLLGGVSFRDPALIAGTPQVRVHPLPMCFSLLLPQSTIDAFLQSRAHLISPGWLKQWRAHLTTDGFTAATAPDFFHEHARRLVFLDSGVLPESDTLIREFADFVRLPYETVPTGLDHFHRILSELLLQEENAVLQARLNETQQEQRRGKAEFAMMADALNSLAKTRSEEKVIEYVVYLFCALFSPGQILFLPYLDGKPTARLSSLIPVSENEHQEFINRLCALTSRGGRLPDAKGFFLTLDRDSETLGVIAILEVAFPDYLDRYYSAAQSLAPVIGMALDNSRFFARQKRQIEDIRRLAHEAAEANASKTEFLANISHEIRTPLNTVLGTIALLLDSPLSEEQHDMLAATEMGSRMLLSTLNAILDSSKLENGKYELSVTPFSLHGMIRELTTFYTPIMHNKRISFQSTIGDGTSDWVMGDSGALRRVLTNLIGNSLKFTETGEIRLLVSPSRSPDGRLHCRFTVSDTGPGISETKIAKLFQPFSQGDSSTRKKYGGTGLGLFIAKSLVERMGGEIGVESSVDIGTTFFFHLPLLLAPEIPTSHQTHPTPSSEAKTPTSFPLGAKASSPAQNPSSRFSPRVLVVEDHPINRKIVCRLLGKMGFTALTADSGNAAIHAFSTQPVDLILMDIQMPDMDGLEATRRIRALSQYSEGKPVPIIAMTAHSTADFRAQSLEAGMSDFLTKPVSHKELEKKIRDLLGKSF